MSQLKQRENNAFCGLNVKALKDIFHNNANPAPPAPGPYKPTCVFLLLYNLAEPHILAIQKTDTEGYPWRNQVALPGGHLEKEDASPLAGAFRELEEETRISCNRVELIGSLGHYQTINGRDIENSDTIPLIKGLDGMFTLEDRESAYKKAMSISRGMIVEAVKEGADTQKDIASETGLGAGLINQQLRRMLKQGLVMKKAHGKYCLPEKTYSPYN